MYNKKVYKVLTIAGSDSGGGAGIQADLKTFAALGVYGMSALTAVTAQNTVRVDDIFVLPVDFVGKQIEAVMKDIGADTWKTGMLAKAEIIEVVAKLVKKYQVKYLVVDPVMVAKSGDLLLSVDAKDTLIKKLIPISLVITPNYHEAQAITGLPIKTLKDMQKAAVIIHQMGAKNIVVKGGHLSQSTKAIDIFYDGKKFKQFASPRIKTDNDHGTGCTFSSAIAAYLAKGKNIPNAVRLAKNYLTGALKSAVKFHVGNGHGPLNHFFNINN